MRYVWDQNKEQSNIRNHGLQFLLAVPLAITVETQFEGGEHRYLTIGEARNGRTILVLVHSQPDPDDDALIRVIGLRQATAHERRRYEEGDD